MCWYISLAERDCLTVFVRLRLAARYSLGNRAFGYLTMEKTPHVQIRAASVSLLDFSNLNANVVSLRTERNNYKMLRRNSLSRQDFVFTMIVNLRNLWIDELELAPAIRPEPIVRSKQGCSSRRKRIERGGGDEPGQQELRGTGKLLLRTAPLSPEQ